MNDLPNSAMASPTCPACGYSLQGCAESEHGVTCPECGKLWQAHELALARNRSPFRNRVFVAACAVPVSAAAAMWAALLVRPMHGGFDFLVVIAPVASIFVAVTVVVAATFWSEATSRRTSRAVLAGGTALMGLLLWPYALAVLFIPNF